MEPPPIRGFSAIEFLPSELQHMICSLLPKEDLLQLRLTCKALACAGDIYLIRTINLFDTTESLDGLLEIARNPVFGPRITHLKFFSGQMQGYPTYESWFDKFFEIYVPRSLDKVDSRQCINGTVVTSDGTQRAAIRAWKDNEEDFKALYPNGDIQTGWRRYKQLIEDQNLSVVPLRIAAEAPAVLPNLSRLKHLIFERHMTTSGDPSVGNGSMALAACSIMRAMAQANIKLDSLTVRVLDGLFDDTMMQDTMYDDMLGVVNAMKSIRICSCKERHKYDIRRVSHFVKLACSARTLETFKLAHADPIFFGQFLEKAQWYCLKTCSLNYVYVHERGLTDFLKFHRHTLEHLGLGNLYLGFGTWRRLFTEMAGKFDVLHKINLVGNLYSVRLTAEVDIEYNCGSGFEYYTERAKTLTTALESYIIKGGRFPELQAVQFPETKEPPEYDGNGIPSEGMIKRSINPEDSDKYDLLFA